jgi:sulfonate transport system substrate-binding protein
VALASFTGAAYADKPTVIRLSFPGVGVGNRPVSGGSVIGTVQLQGKLEQEFEKDGIKIEWSFLRGAGPAVNEAYANGLVDFSTLGDLPSIVGHASGLKYRVLASSGVRGNTYVAVPADSNIQSVKDLRGKRVAMFKGTAGQLSANKILASFGLSEKDVRAINMDTNTARLALVTKDVDASFGSSDYLGLRDQGTARIIYTTKGQAASLGSNGLFLGSEDFIRKYPEITQRVLKVYVQVAKWIADQDAAPNPYLQLWTKSGATFGSYKEDFRGEPTKYKLSPLVDPLVIANYEEQIKLTKQYGLIKEAFPFAPWLSLGFLQRALKETGLENFWPIRNRDGSIAAQQASSAAATSAVTPALTTAQR